MTVNRATLVKVLEILDSSNAGEALAAAKLASTLVREAGLTWEDVVAPEIGAPALPASRAAASPAAAPPPADLPAADFPASGHMVRNISAGAGPFGYRREQRELSPHEQFFMVLLSPRTPSEIKRKLRSLEARVLDGEITPQETQDLKFMYQSFVAG